MQKSAAKVIEGEDLDVTLGSMPLKGEEKNAVKANVLRILKEKYDFEEADFVSAELEIVPAGPSRDYGLDRSMVAGYGHDDRVCAYTSLRAVIDMDFVPTYTACCVLVDKEEVGSIGATGAQSKFFADTIMYLIDNMGTYSEIKLRKALTNTKMLSSDVSAGYDPLFAYVNDSKNAAYLGHGLCFNKYTGSRGKSGANDAMPEYMAEIRNLLDSCGVNYQTAELGKVDQGGGGTIAYILGNENMYVIDAGVAVLCMHAPMEIVSKADVYEAYQGYKAFLTLE
jgi:aspartyl aminopeptidase